MAQMRFVLSLLAALGISGERDGLGDQSLLVGGLEGLWYVHAL